MLAMGLGPHWMLTETDAKRYGQALANAARHFPVRTTQKAIDIGVLIMTAFVIDAPRIGMTIQMSKARATPPTPRRGPAQVFQFTPNPAQNGGAPPTQPSAQQAAQTPPPPPLADPPPPLEEQGGGGYP